MPHCPAFVGSAFTSLAVVSGQWQGRWDAGVGKCRGHGGRAVGGVAAHPGGSSGAVSQSVALLITAFLARITDPSLRRTPLARFARPSPSVKIPSTCARSSSRPPCFFRPRTSASMIAPLPPTGNSRDAFGRYQSSNMNPSGGGFGLGGAWDVAKEVRRVMRRQARRQRRRRFVALSFETYMRACVACGPSGIF